MEKAKLIVKNFGPLKDIEIEVREMVTFIGAQASGKSTLAKLLSIFEDADFRRDDKISFEEELKKYSIFSYWNENSEIHYFTNVFEFHLKGRLISKTKEFNKIISQLLDYKNTSQVVSYLNQLHVLNLIKINSKTKKDLYNNIINILNIVNNYIKFDPLYNPLENKELFELINSIFYYTDSVYIPTERAFLHLIAENTLGLINNNVQIPKHLLNVGQDYEKAIQTIKELPLYIIDKKLKYKREGKSSYIYHDETEKIDLLESASGLQSIIPILLLVEYANTLKDKYNFNFVVEEPELNLYPKAQHELIKYLVKNCLTDRRNLILTTHSPFVLASLNNLLLAFDKGKSKPKEVAKIISKASWLNPKNFIAYQLKNGKAYKIMDDKLGQIKENMIDSISDDFSDEFDKLLEV
ncbi:AAA domain-containing protein [Flavobacterium branchiophilum]|uniref:Endonuclease GajA/Old nuclease/RecF-like AAA domain-containing protein n=1 Tax=Flavobacterium branchiophilum (strain FL-15) TaxID=1034807 RepID=G2Z4L0_FLABF|nr:AAA family ATPase [Flavobacterium branchiophilum]CCB68486.1 Protein of unknown function [Flavobacterium branchiophilum FL-15]